MDKAQKDKFYQEHPNYKKAGKIANKVIIITAGLVVLSLIISFLS